MIARARRPALHFVLSKTTTRPYHLNENAQNKSGKACALPP